MVRGSGLNGLVSFNKSVKYKDEDLNILRPLLNLEKNDLINISKIVFKFLLKIHPILMRYIKEQELELY